MTVPRLTVSSFRFITRTYFAAKCWFWIRAISSTRLKTSSTCDVTRGPFTPVRPVSIHCSHTHTQTRDTWTTSLTRETVPFNKHICAKLRLHVCNNIKRNQNLESPKVQWFWRIRFIILSMFFVVVKGCGSSFKQTSTPFIQECFLPNLLKLDKWFWIKHVLIFCQWILVYRISNFGFS